MPIFEGLGEVVDQCLGINEEWAGQPPRYRHIATLQQLCQQNGPDVDGNAFIENLYARVLQNWNDAPQPRGLPTVENWRFAKQLEYDENNATHEVTLERTIAAVVDENWANQVPVDSGLLNARAHYIDLVFRAGSAFSLIELKYESNTPLSAACQVLSYGLVYAFFKCHDEEINVNLNASPILGASELHLRVLAPLAYFAGYGAGCTWLSRFETAIDRGVRQFAQRHARTVPPMSFAFERFPNDFVWNPAQAQEIPMRQSVLWAVHRRQRVFL